MKQKYFLGANTRRGFYSLYREFPPGPDAFLHILKSGPGTGKSGFLRRIGKAAEDRGMDVHYVLCSGDPDSLDGVYVPDLHQAWVDGTAPHVIEPRIFGADSDYINLGAFFRRPFEWEEHEELNRLNRAYRACYDSAYQKLEEYSRSHDPNKDFSESKTLSAVLEEIPEQETPGNLSHRFLRAITCQGIMELKENLEGFQILPCSADDLKDGADTFCKKGWDAVLCPEPLDPDRMEALLLPKANLAFTSFSKNDEADPSLCEALKKLAEAKSLHDELEAIYKSHIHFSALDDYTESVIDRLFHKQ